MVRTMSFLALGGLVGLGACSSEPIGSSADKVTGVNGSWVVSVSYPSYPPGTGSGVETQETSAVWQAGGVTAVGTRFSPSWLVGMNSFLNPACGLAVASDTAPPLAWAKWCTIDHDCNGGAPAPPATDVPRGGFVTQQSCDGDPFLASTRIAYGGGYYPGGDVVVYIAMATSTLMGASHDMIVGAVSFDGGGTFGTTST